MVAWIKLLLFVMGFCAVTVHASLLGPVNTTIEHSIMSDYVSEMKPRKYNHSTSLAFSTCKLYWELCVGVGAGFDYQTMGNSILAKRAESSGIAMSDTSVIISKKFDLNKYWNLRGEHALKAKVGGNIPTSKNSQYEEIKSVLKSAILINSQFFNKGYNIANQVDVKHIMNKYGYSRITGEPYPNKAITFTHMHQVPIYKGLSIYAGFSYKRSSFRDGINKMTFANRIGTSLSYKKLTLDTSYTGGDHITNEKINFWYINKARRIVSFSMGYSF